MDTQTFKSQTRKYRNYVITGLVVLCIIGGGSYWAGHYYHNQQKLAKAEAQTNMLKAQAESNHLKLLSEDQVKALTATAVGVPEDQLTFKSINLIEFNPHHVNPADKHKDHGDKHHDKKDGDHYDHKQATPNGPLPVPPAPNVPAPQAAPGAPAQPNQPVPPTASAAQSKAPAMMPPIYRVTATANGITYNLLIDSVTGKVIASHIK